MYILGPCAIENTEMYLNIGCFLNKVMENREWYYKASFDKANRTSIKGQRGIGYEDGLDLFHEIKRLIPNIKLTTDVHECWQIDRDLIEAIDVVQIPAFLCRQTDLIVECARYFNKINIKKGQWLGPNNLIKSVDKVKETNPDAQVWLTNRGSNFGYHILLVDNTIVDELKSYYDKVILDCTHSTQRSRTVYGMQGDRELAKRYFLSAGIFNYDGIFAEVHHDPNAAISDGDCQIELKNIYNLIQAKEDIDDVLYKRQVQPIS